MNTKSYQKACLLIRMLFFGIRSLIYNSLDKKIILRDSTIKPLMAQKILERAKHVHFKKFKKTNIQ